MSDKKILNSHQKSHTQTHTHSSILLLYFIPTSSTHAFSSLLCEKRKNISLFVSILQFDVYNSHLDFSSLEILFIRSIYEHFQENECTFECFYHIHVIDVITETLSNQNTQKNTLDSYAMKANEFRCICCRCLCVCV